MPQWCNPEDVEHRLKSVHGANFTGDDIQLRIERGRRMLLSQLAGKFAKDRLDEWDDADIDTIPPQLRELNAALAAAYVLQDYVEGESISDRQSKAGGLYYEFQQSLTALLNDKAMLTATESDNTAQSGTRDVITSTTAGKDRVFTRDTLDRL